MLYEQRNKYALDICSSILLLARMLKLVGMLFRALKQVSRTYRQKIAFFIGVVHLMMTARHQITIFFKVVVLVTYHHIFFHSIVGFNFPHNFLFH